MRFRLRHLIVAVAVVAVAAVAAVVVPASVGSNRHWVAELDRFIAAPEGRAGIDWQPHQQALAWFDGAVFEPGRSYEFVLGSIVSDPDRGWIHGSKQTVCGFVADALGNGSCSGRARLPEGEYWQVCIVDTAEGVCIAGGGNPRP